MRRFKLISSLLLLLLLGAQNVACQSVAKLPIFAMCDPTVWPSPCGINAVCGTTVAGACQRGICMCASPDFAPLFYNSTDCGRLLQPGDPCSATSDTAMLIPEYAQCKNGVVTCTMDLIAMNHTCVAPTSIKGTPGENCDDTVGCNEALLLTCTQVTERVRQCQCGQNLLFKDGRCQPALFGDPCTTDSQCNVIYNGGSRSTCTGGTCICGASFIKVSAVVRTPPSSTLLRNMSAASVLGYYCVSTLLLPKMTAAAGENCTVPLPTGSADQFSLPYCTPGLACIHCAESGPLTEGICRNVTALIAMQPSASSSLGPTQMPSSATLFPGQTSQPQHNLSPTTQRVGVPTNVPGTTANLQRTSPEPQRGRSHGTIVLSNRVTLLLSAFILINYC